MCWRCCIRAYSDLVLSFIEFAASPIAAGNVIQGAKVVSSIALKFENSR